VTSLSTLTKEDHGLDSELQLELMGNESVLIVRLGAFQPLLALHFLTTEYHQRTVTVPLDSGNFDVVSARDHSRALRVT
jgi:hypothetical protein